MAKRISALTITVAVALIGAALATVPLMAHPAAPSGACMPDGELNSGYGIGRSIEAMGCGQPDAAALDRIGR